jgi:ubiquitin-like modifier-activating enzyme ATG7
MWSGLPEAVPGQSLLRGHVVCLNAREALGSFDRKQLSSNIAQEIWRSIQNGEAALDPCLVNQFGLLVYCDLKTFTYYSLMCHPVLESKGDCPYFEQSSIIKSFKLWFEDVERRNHASSVLEKQQGNAPCGFLVYGSPSATDSDRFTYLSISEMIEYRVDRSFEKIAFVFWDPSGMAGYPGWGLRNLLVLVRKTFSFGLLTIICARTKRGKIDSDRSIVFDVSFSEEVSPDFKVTHGFDSRPRVSELGGSLDPMRLAASAVDLNIQLMKWRASPLLDASIMSQKKCLLIGAGTLGCSVARALLGWGVRHITMVDNGRVSFSNPVRQSLYSYEDCLSGGQMKATAAAAALRRIFPLCSASGINMTIPMPGHFATEDEIIKNTKMLEELIASHDAVFLLLDTREARWAPTVIATALNKLTITAALGFDTYLTMRHGSKKSKDVDLGCYFCNDVVAPKNSTVDRSMDQQCTVARPGLSGICGSLAVELFASTVQHPLGMNAPASTAHSANVTDGAEDSDSPLGEVPHMIRGSLHGFAQQCFIGSAFDLCTACSKNITSAYLEEREAFMVDAVSDADYLEKVSGLQEFYESCGDMHLQTCSPENLLEDGRVTDDEWTEL